MIAKTMSVNFKDYGCVVVFSADPLTPEIAENVCSKIFKTTEALDED